MGVAFCAWSVLHPRCLCGAAGLQWFGGQLLGRSGACALAVGPGRGVGKAVSASRVQTGPLYGLLLTIRIGSDRRRELRETLWSSGRSYPVARCPARSDQPGVQILRSIVPGYLASLVICGGTCPDRADPPRITLRAATENAQLLQAFGVNVRCCSRDLRRGVALAALAGVLCGAGHRRVAAHGATRWEGVSRWSSSAGWVPSWLGGQRP